MEGGRVRPSYCQGLYGVIPPRASDIIAISVQQFHTIGRRDPRRFLSTAASGKEQGDDHCGSEASRCVPFWQRMCQYAHRREICTHPTAIRVGWEGADRNGG